MTSFFSAEGGPIWIKFRRLLQNDMSTAVIWSKSKPDVEFQYGGRFGEFNGMSSQSHFSHCRVLPLGEFTVIIPVPHARLQGVIITSAILKIVFRHILFIFWFFLMQFGLRRAAAFVSSPLHLFRIRLFSYFCCKYVIKRSFSSVHYNIINRRCCLIVVTKDRTTHLTWMSCSLTSSFQVVHILLLYICQNLLLLLIN